MILLNGNKLTSVNGRALVKPEKALDEYEQMFQTNQGLEIKHCAKGELVEFDVMNAGDLRRDHIGKTVYFAPYSGTYVQEHELISVKITDLLFFESRY